MSPLWNTLLSGLAVAAILMTAWEYVLDDRRISGRQRQAVVFGLLTAAGTLASMSMAQQVIPGFFFDLRAPLIAAAGFFGGVPAVAITAGAAFAFRFHTGGAGMIVGLSGIVLTTLIGLACRWGLHSRKMSSRSIIAFSLAVTLGQLVQYLILPQEIWFDLLAQTGIPIALLTFTSAFLIGMMFLRARRRRELAATNTLYRAMVDALPDCLNVKDLEGRFVAANPATAALMRAGSSEALIGRTDFDFYPAEVARRFREDESALRAGGGHATFDQPAVFADGSHGWLATLKAPLFGRDGGLRGIITHNRDITEQKKSQALKSEFISVVSHELRTPLTSIRGSLGLVVAGVGGELPAKAARLVRIAHSNSERLVTLINDILDMEKIDSGKLRLEMKQGPACPIVAQAVEASGNIAPEKRLEIVLDDAAPGAEVVVDAGRLHQVIANLLSNAVKFSPEGGRIDVALRLEADRLRITVSDQGPGIPEAFRDRIFGKFEQADGSDVRQKGGTGLGLSIAKALVESMHGTLGFDNRPGEGAAFHIDLPAVGGAPATEVLPPAAADARGRVLICEAERQGAAQEFDRRPRVLHVEDDEDVLQVMASALGAEVSITFARSLREAREMLERHRFDLVILDIGLPDGSGLDLICASPAETALIVFSADEMDPGVTERVTAMRTKTRTSEIAIALMVRGLLKLEEKEARA